VNRILVIRGGAIGDFILTLPALKALRQAYPGSHIEILGYAHIAALAKGRFYADAVRSIEYGALSRFFARGAELPRDLSHYFAGFDLVVSYLFDPDLIFRTNIERAGVDEIIAGPGKLSEDVHAALQLAQPMISDLELELETTSAAIFPAEEDRAFAAEFLRDLPDPIIALHPGSGSERKNWPLRKWIELGNKLLKRPNFECSLIVIGGEADEAQASELQSQWKDSRVRFARNLPLIQLAAALEKTIFAGHDSGISHLAAAVGAPCVLLFGPTNPEIWAPTNPGVRVLRAPGGNLHALGVDAVMEAVLAKVGTAPLG
jgi:heptosyltransferase III